MTTIVCTPEVMVSDTQSTHNFLVTKEKKLFKTEKGIAGASGDSQDCLAFIGWMNGGEEPEEIGEDFEALVLNKEGIFWYGRRLIGEPISADYYSIGSGSHIAIGAMIMGADPEEAVKAACKWTNESDTPLQIIYL